jgi:hydroxyacylglutathione hydrolase
MEIKSGVYLLEGIKGANCYFVSDQEGAYLIDTGMPGNAERIIQEILKISQKPEEIRYILLTHPDIDHAGSVAALKSRTKAKIAIHEQDAPSLAGEQEGKKVKGLLGWLFRLILKNIKFETIQPDLLLKDGETIGPFKVIHVPGHTPGSVCFFNAAQSLIFAGDALRTDKNGTPCLSPDIMNDNSALARESLKKLAVLDFQMMLPGHGKPILKDAAKKVALL